MKITNLTTTDRPAWDEYVRNAEHGLLQHLSGWRDVLKRTYNYETPFLLVKESGGHLPEASDMTLRNGVPQMWAAGRIMALVYKSIRMSLLCEFAGWKRC